MLNTAKVRALAKQNGLSISFLMGKLNEESGYLHRVEHGKRRVTEHKIKALADALHTTYAYLTDETDDPSSPKEIIPPVKIKVFGDVAAGSPIEQIDNFDPDEASSFEEINERTARKGDYFALRIKGDSMLPEMKTGDVVICKAQECAEDGDVVVVGIADEATCKKLKKTSKGIYLLPFNAEFEPMFYSNEEIEQYNVRILGKVVEVRRKM